MKQLSNSLEVLVLAAGLGKRMASRLPKVLHTLAGRPLLGHVLDTVSRLDPVRVHVVIGHAGDQVRDAVGGDVVWVDQSEQRGTGDAVRKALPGVADASVVLVVFGDVPLVTAESLGACAEAAAGGALALVTAVLEQPGQLGRILRDGSGHIRGIVEYADAGDDERAIREINSGILAAPRAMLDELAGRLTADNAQGEYYLTDIVGMAVADGLPVRGLTVSDPAEVLGINNRAELARVERQYQRRLTDALMQGGVSMADPERVDIRGRLVAGRDCYLDVNVVFEGEVSLGDCVYVGPGAVIRNAALGDDVRVEAHTVIDGARIGDGCQLGPFARLRPGTELAQGVKIGNFVETKKAVLGAGSKASHLAYLGDATVGAGCNVGAGAVTCNYDGVDKHPTIIGDRVFVGTNATLVAPLVIESDAYVAAGSTVTTRVGEHELAVGRSRQRNIQGWVRPDRRKRES